jgi:hypothetical protein
LKSSFCVFLENGNVVSQMYLDEFCTILAGAPMVFDSCMENTDTALGYNKYFFADCSEDDPVKDPYSVFEKGNWMVES